MGPGFRQPAAQRPAGWPTLGDHAYFLAPAAAEQAAAAPVKIIADDLADEAAAAANAERLRQRETNAVRRRDAASK